MKPKLIVADLSERPFLVLLQQNQWLATRKILKGGADGIVILMKGTLGSAIG
jgi:hypothetical protein